MPDSHVVSAKINGKKNIVLSIYVDAFLPGESVEISGYAMQDYDGGFATFSKVQTIKPSKSGVAPTLTVTATTVPGKGFVQGQDVTICLQVSKVWMTVLSEQKPTASVEPESQPAPKDYQWGYVEKVGGPDKYSSRPPQGTPPTQSTPPAQSTPPVSGTTSTGQAAVAGSPPPGQVAG